MSLFKRAVPTPSKGKVATPAKGKGDVPTKSKVPDSQYTHPPVEPLGFLAIENIFCPMTISSQGLACHIDMVEGKDYTVKTVSGQRVISSETIPPSDRKKKAVTEFMFKGLIGIHMHPAGMVLTLDQEKNLQGQPRLNQPPLEIVSAPPPANIDEIRASRLFSFNLNECTADKPMVIATNKEHMHFQIRLIESDHDNEWGMFISSPKGVVREDSKPVLLLKKGVQQRIDRQFFTQLAGSSGGGIDARTWNRDVLDPIIMDVKVNSDNLLIIEDMFTVNGLSILTGMEKITYVGARHGNSQEQHDAHVNECEQTMAKIRDAIKEGIIAHGQEMALANERKKAVRGVRLAIHKHNNDGIGVLALELATKEVLGPGYTGPGGSESGLSVTHETLRLLNAITNELCGWVEADSTRATAVAAINQAISDSAFLTADGLDKKLLKELPKVDLSSAEKGTPAYTDVVSLANRTFNSKAFAKEIRSLAKDINTASDNAIKQTLANNLDANIKQVARTILQKSLVRMAVKSQLLDIEKNKREELNFDPTMVSDQPFSERELETVLTRYDAYAEYMNQAFEARISKPLSGVIRDYQVGTNDEQMHSLSTKSFLVFLVALRTSGGSVSEKTDSSPQVSSLQALPDAIPDIQISQPDPAEPKGLVRMVHREGVLLEVPFDLAPRSGLVPEGVPNGVWFGFHDLSERIMGFFLSSETQKKRDRDQDNLAIANFTKLILLRVLNLFRNIQNLPSGSDFTEIQSVLEKALGLLSIRAGESAEEEFLDIRNRPKHVTEPAINIRQELRQMLLGMEKSGELAKDSFRFKQRARSLALMGGGKNQEKALLPITIRAQNGLISIDAKFNDEVFSKAIRLLPEGAVAPAPDDVEPITTRTVRSPEQKAPAQQQSPAPPKNREDAVRLNRAVVFKLVNNLPFFARFSEFEKKRITEQDLSFKVFQKDQMIIEEGTHDTAFFVLIKGNVSVVKGSKIITKFGPGEMFGEISFLTNTPRTMSIKANETVLVMRLDQEMMHHMEQESREKFKDHIIAKQVARLADTTLRLAGTVTQGTVIQGPIIEGELKAIDRDQAMAMMDKLPFFTQFSSYEKRRITAFNTSFRMFRTNGEIIREGTLETSFYIIIDGAVDVVKGGTVVAQLGPGEFFGDMAFLTNTPRTSSVISKGSVLTMKVDQDLMRRMGSEIREKLKDQFLLKLTQRLLHTTGKTLKGK